MKKRMFRIAVSVAMVVGIITTAVPAHADPCDVNVKDIVVIDLINCG